MFVTLGGGVVGETDVGQTSKDRVGRAEGEVSGGPPSAREFGKNVSCSSDIWQVPRRAWARNRLMRSMHTNWSLPSLLEIRTSSTGHLAGGRKDVSPSVYLWVGTNCMCPVGIRIRVSKLGCLRIAAEYHGVSSQTGSTRTTRKGVVVSVDGARAWRIAFLMSPRSYSGFAMHDYVSR